MTKTHISFCDAVAKHFGASKATIRAVAEKYFKELGINHPILELDLVDQIGVSFKIGCSKNTIHLSNMFFYDKLKKTELYTDIINTFENTNADALVFFSGPSTSPGSLIVVYQDTVYKGTGGILVRGNGEGYVCEPVAHYLEANYPKCNYRDEC
jgi:hypothetical protein